MTNDQLMGLLRQFMPIIGTMLTVFGLSSATANNLVNLIMSGAGPAMTLYSLVWSFIVNSRASIIASAAKPVAPGIPAPIIVLPVQETDLAQSLPANVQTTATQMVVPVAPKQGS